MSVELIREFQLACVDPLVDKSCIEACRDQTGITHHLMVGNGTIGFGGGQGPGPRIVTEDHAPDTHPSILDPVAEYLRITPDAHGPVWYGHHGGPLIPVVSA